MNYKIHTTPLWDAFSPHDCDCPFCELERSLESRSVSQYLNEAVMVPEYRARVNRLGFCGKHFDALLNGDNVCGVALQTQTRLDAVIQAMTLPTNVKTAEKERIAMGKLFDGCVICAEVSETMQRYLETAAAMFLKEPPFKKLFQESDGFCMKHYADLLGCAKSAGKYAELFLDVLNNVQRSRLARLKHALNGFVEQFDSQKKGVPRSAECKGSLPKTVSVIKSV